MNPKKLPNRKSNRLKGYDYSNPGFYFVTICCKDMQHLFGYVIQEKMILNELGVIAHKEWLGTESLRDNIRLHEFIIMPNHMHGIIEIISPECIGMNCYSSELEEINRKAVRMYSHTSEQDKINRSELVRTYGYTSEQDKINRSELVRTYSHTSVRDAIESPNEENAPSRNAINSSHKPESEFASPSRNLGAIIRGYKSAATKQINQLRDSVGTKVWHGNYYEHIIRNEQDFQRISEYIRRNPAQW